mmetsp:Transcript_25510/g.55505  ORF Transcript_25510/g.55505 Transcript_25510/m.55505 type:complete len:303 (-) Transcript_25510:747-1655(-)
MWLLSTSEKCSKLFPLLMQSAHQSSPSSRTQMLLALSATLLLAHHYHVSSGRRHSQRPPAPLHQGLHSSGGTHVELHALLAASGATQVGSQAHAPITAAPKGPDPAVPREHRTVQGAGCPPHHLAARQVAGGGAAAGVVTGRPTHPVRHLHVLPPLQVEAPLVVQVAQLALVAGTHAVEPAISTHHQRVWARLPWPFSRVHHPLGAAHIQCSRQALHRCRYRLAPWTGGAAQVAPHPTPPCEELTRGPHSSCMARSHADADHMDPGVLQGLYRLGRSTVLCIAVAQAPICSGAPAVQCTAVT